MSPFGPPGASQTHARRRLWLATALVIVLGAGLRIPGLLAGFHSDDYQQLAMLNARFVLERPAWDLFWFGPRSPSELDRLVAFGFDPWWTAESHRLSMFRPLSSVLIHVDHTLFGDRALLFHLHSLAWWAALVSAVALLASRVLPAAVAVGAVVLFALDAAHNVPIAWLANRSTLVSATLGTLALWAHIRARTHGHGAQVIWLALSAVLWALALAGGEYGFGLLAFVLAFELLGNRDGVRARALRLSAPFAVACAYLLLRAELGHGVSGSGQYISPSDPVRYAVQASTRSLALVADLVLGVPASWFHSNTPFRNQLLELQLFDPPTWRRLPDWQTLHAVIGGVALVCAALLLRWIGRSGRAELGAVRWLALGSLLALPAAAATAPSARLLVAPAIGASALVAAALATAAVRARRSALLGLLCAALLCVHVVLAGHQAYADSARLRRHAEAVRRWSLDAEIPSDPRDTDVVIVSAIDFATSTNLPWIRSFHGLPLPRSYLRLSGAQQAHALRRLDAHSIELSVLSADVRDAFAGSIYRPRESPLEVGTRVRLPAMEVEVLAARGGNPHRLLVRFARELDDPRLVFLHARPEGLRRFTPPEAGQSVLLPRPALPK